MSNLEVSQVRALLQQFQDGYTACDLTQLDEFMALFVDSDDLEVIGTNAVMTGVDEWCMGPEAVRELIAGDWQHWGDVRFDVQGAHISVEGNVAWLATTGTVTDRIPVEDRHEGYLDYVKDVLAQDGTSDQLKLMEIVRLGNDIVLGLSLPDVYVWPLRLAAVAVRDGDQWRFHQMQFSFATTRAPDVRYL